jgi:hypothetical protein
VGLGVVAGEPVLEAVQPVRVEPLGGDLQRDGLVRRLRPDDDRDGVLLDGDDRRVVDGAG